MYVGPPKAQLGRPYGCNLASIRNITFDKVISVQLQKKPKHIHHISPNSITQVFEVT